MLKAPINILSLLRASRRRRAPLLNLQQNVYDTPDKRRAKKSKAYNNTI